MINLSQRGLPALMPKPPSMVPSSELSRNELVDMIGRLRAAAFVDLPSLPQDRQQVVRHILGGTAIKNTEPRSEIQVRLHYAVDERVVYLTVLDDDTETVSEIEDADAVVYHGIEAALLAVAGNAKLTREKA